MDSDLDANGDSTTGSLLRKLKAMNIRFPRIILNFFLNILNEKDVFDQMDQVNFVRQMKVSKINAGDKLSIHKLQSFHHIFNRCPMFTAQTNNNS